MTDPHTIGQVFREESGRVLAALIGRLRDFDLAEEAMQEAFARALRVWPEQGIPDSPRAWLLTTATRQAIDWLRRHRVFVQKKPLLQEGPIAPVPEEEWLPDAIPDERLRLMFTCCHPVLPIEAQVALTLRTLGGLTTPEIARAFLVPDTTLAQRLVRAKRKIKQAAIPYEVPAADVLPERLASVLAVIYLVFNEGYAASAGDAPTRADLCEEAIRLARMAVDLMPDEPEALGLLALMLLHDSRRDARLGTSGAMVPLDAQDRSQWDRVRIAEGVAVVQRALSQGRPGPYQIQAAISALHADADRWDATDWPQIAGLYAELARRHPSPVVELNRAVAVAMASGPEAGLAHLETVEGLGDYQPYHAARADLLRRLGRADAARVAYRRAIALTDNEAERRFLRARLDSISP